MPVTIPPPDIFNIVQYDSPVGKLDAYITPDPDDGRKHPAIIWIVGGDCNTISDVWTEAPIDDDQTASVFWKSGIITMYPSLRGGNMNPGYKEGFYGEVNDVLAAADYLASQNYVDPNRIYLGGHSTGGTLVLLTAEHPNRFRAVFAVSPAADSTSHSPAFVPFDTTSSRDVELRAPILWLHSVKSPLFIITGMQEPRCNDFLAMSRATNNPRITFVPVSNAAHCSICYPINTLLASKILSDTGKTTNISITGKEADAQFDSIWSR